MTPFLVDLLCDPANKHPLSLLDETYDEDGNIVSGKLVGASGREYPIVNGIPRFIDNFSLKSSVDSFGDQWNFFNFTDFKRNWLEHTVKNTFGSKDAFKDKVIIDAGGGSGAQTLWMLESGAKHVILLDLSDSVDDVVLRNLLPSGYKNFDVIQCSIDLPPIKAQSIEGMVICHNVIQHTPSVEKTAKALYDIVAPEGEFVFNCYKLNDQGFVRWFRFHMIFSSIRALMQHLPFWAIHGYAKLMGLIRLIPVIGDLAETSMLCVRGDVPAAENETIYKRLKREYKTTVLNTFDIFGSHDYQHYKTDDEIKSLVLDLQPNQEKVANLEKYFETPTPRGCAIRVYR